MSLRESLNISLSSGIEMLNKSFQFVTALMGLHRTAFSSLRYVKAAAEYWRVCRAWHRTREVKVLLPGVRRAEG
ncbi:hypothetical protein BY454_1588 [Marinobacter persicus]|uniref:Uncharacterized protein n=1 Tax=Marinobacter persicus TaxID=930118 RepID=A0A2S6G1X2_9GAMM|nr:hypothetical protein BY455_1558 [Marinobacter persicus]PPK50829.1 hypothetical protein B0H24_10608 [Marinobacter persicus]PPK55401.1 hypothetical protein BY454_1588 [Marinobacter persicus]